MMNKHQRGRGQGDRRVDARGVGAVQLGAASDAAHARGRRDPVEAMREVTGMAHDH